MNYGRLDPNSESFTKAATTSSSSSSQPPNHQPIPTPKPKSKLKLLILILGFTLIILASALSLTLRNKSSGSGSSTHPQPTKSISRVCSRTLYQNLCVNSFLDFPGSLVASEKQLVHISVNMTLHHVGRALYTSSDLNNLQMDGPARSAYNDCLELMEDSVDQLTRSLNSVHVSSSSSSNSELSSPEDVMTWLSASLTNQDTCTEGLSETEEGQVRTLMEERIKDLSELVSNSLAIYSFSSDDDDDDDDENEIPVGRKLMTTPEFPDWMREKERRLMETPAALIQADIVVDKGGKNGTCKTIKEAIKKAPEHSDRRFIIYVKAGR